MVRIIFVLIFILITVLPTLMMPFYKNEHTAENRAMKERPDPSLYNMLDIFDDWQEYYADHFAFRDKLSSAFINIKMKLLKTDPLPEKVREGKDGWFYLGNSYWNVYNASLGAEKINEAKIDKVASAVMRMKAFCDSLNIGFYLIIPPNKHTIYPEWLPVRPNTYNPQKRDVLMQRLANSDGGIEMIDPVPGLIKLKDSVRIFYKTDSHWNDLGASYATGLLLDRIRERYDVGAFSKEDYAIEEKEKTRMDETGMLNIRRHESFLSLKPLPGRVPQYIDSVVNGRTVSTYNRNRPLKIVLFRDSFFTGMIPFFAPQVGDVRYEWTAFMSKKVVLEEKPDLVILEIVERAVLEVNM